MGRNVSIKFRGEDVDIEIVADHGYEPDTGAHDLEWRFVGGHVDELTAAEEQAIMEQLYEAVSEPDESDYL